MKLKIFAVVFALVPTLAQAWWSEEWQFRKKISVTAAESADTPVLVGLHSGNFGYFKDTQASGADVRFLAGDDKTELPFHIEKYDAINGIGLLWVKVPHDNKQIWMYYGNPNAKATANVAGSFDANQALVYHFDDATGVTDKTQNNNNPVQQAFSLLPSGIFGQGARFSGKDFINVASSQSLSVLPNKGMTFSAWVKMDGAQSDAYVMQLRDGGAEFVFGIDGLVPYARYTDAAGRAWNTPREAPLSKAGWHHLAFVASPGHLTVFADGKPAGSIAAPFGAMNGSLTIGAAADAKHGLVGQVDEVQVANTARSNAWVGMAAAQGQDGNGIALGDDEVKAEETTSYFTVILKNVTVDGWAVIIILAIMALIGWMVMIGKGIVIYRAGKDNTAFLEQFRRLGKDDPTKLDAAESDEERDLSGSPVSLALFGKHDHFQSSPLYHIYHAGVEAVNYRIGKSVGARAVTLSPQAVNTIRATLDAAMVREVQKLNKQMVLLTLSISGGPFLGLLGTVVGVMITFAAIAASGNVDVNAIAPGIAAALVATVAGLAVAIPALFGYNYLGSRIKENIADMHVFVDEFICAVAEHYAE